MDQEERKPYVSRVGMINMLESSREERKEALPLETAGLEKPLKVPKCEIFHLFDFNEFYGIKSL